MAKKDYYEVLGISKNADEKTIKQAYRKMAKKYHPDTNQGNPQAEEKFKEVTEAYNVLSDKEKRKMYDQFGFGAFDGSNGEYTQGSGNPFRRDGFSGASSGNYQEFHFEDGYMDDFLKDFFGHGFGGREDGFGFEHRNYTQKGQDAEAKISISFEDAVSGCDKVIRFQNSDGTEQALKVHIPAGIDSGKKIRLKGKGDPGMSGGTPGDLYLQITVREKQGITRKGNDIYTMIQIPYTTAVFGGETIVHTLYGDVSCKIKEGTQSGSKIRLRGKGMPVMNHPSEKGDQYVTVEIIVPKYLSPDAREKLREYQKVSGM